MSCEVAKTDRNFSLSDLKNWKREFRTTIAPGKWVVNHRNERVRGCICISNTISDTWYTSHMC